MADGSVNVEAKPTASEASAEKPTKKRVRLKQAREQSSISFPYMDLEAAVSVASAILRGGGVAVTREQLAGLLNMTPTSGTFLMKVGSARIFGLLTYAVGKYELTNLGFAALDSSDDKRRRALADAFLAVPLYKRVYDEFRGRQLPPRPHGLEQAFLKFGVAPKQTGNARQVFDRAAKQAGFFLTGQERLIEPIIGPMPTGGGRAASPPPPSGDDDIGRSEPPARTPPGLHPFIQGLLETLPEPATNWAAEGRTKWLQAAAHCFDLMYKGHAQIIVSNATESAKRDEPSGLPFEAASNIPAGKG